jgi:hypothetical protein
MVEENANQFGDQKSRRLWLETAQAFEKLAGDLPQKARERAEVSQSQ